MELAIKILFFLLFLATYGGWAYANHHLSEVVKRPDAAASQPKLVLLQELQAIINYFGLLIFVFLLSGFWNWTLAISFFGTAQIGILVTLALWTIVGAAEQKWLARALWAGYEFDIKYRFFSWTLVALACLIVVGYPIAVGIAYFRHALSSELTVTIFQYTLVMVVLLAIVILPVSIALTASPNLDEDTRSRFLISQLGGLIPNAFIIALVFVAFGGGSFQFSKENLSAKLLLEVTAVVLAFFALTMIIPYLLGVRFARSKRKRFFDNQKRLLSELEDALEPLSAGSIAGLEKVKVEIARSLDNLQAGDAMLGIASKLDVVDADELPPAMQPVVPAYRATRDTDARFRYLDDLMLLMSNIDTAIAELRAKSSEDERVKLAQTWSRVFEKRRERLDERQKTEESGSVVPQLAFSGASIVLSAALGGVGKTLWEKVLLPALHQ